ncbi:MAG: hypothetical protein LBT11_04055 [Treponema sp.]|jgi:hypothetical protein|nr:hypothetical protein [Treponema sp.]
MKLASLLAGERGRQDAAKNRRRLDGAALTSRKLGLLRIADEDIKALIAPLCYEADRYIAASKRDDDALYEPAVLESLDTALSALSAFLEACNDAAAEKHFGAGSAASGAAAAARRDDARIQALESMNESLAAFRRQNGTRSAGSLDAVITGMENNR